MSRKQGRKQEVKQDWILTGHQTNSSKNDNENKTCTTTTTPKRKQKVTNKYKLNNP